MFKKLAIFAITLFSASIGFAAEHIYTLTQSVGVASYDTSVRLKSASKDVVLSAIKGYDGMNDRYELTKFHGDSIPKNTGIFIQGSPNTTLVFEDIDKEPDYAYANLLKPNVERGQIYERDVPSGYKWLYLANGKWRILNQYANMRENRAYLEIPAKYINTYDTVTIASSGISTYSNSKPLHLVKTGVNVKVGTITSFNSKLGFEYTTFLDGFAPSNTGMVIIGTPGAKVVFRETQYEPDFYYANLMRTQTEKSDYIWEDDQPDDSVFVYIAGGKTKKVNGRTGIKKNGAYIVVPARLWDNSASAKTGLLFSNISIEDEITEVNSAKTNVSTQEDGNFYSMDGKKIAAPKKGMFIHNGKKYIIKD